MRRYFGFFPRPAHARARRSLAAAVMAGRARGRSRRAAAALVAARALVYGARCCDGPASRGCSRPAREAPRRSCAGPPAARAARAARHAHVVPRRRPDGAGRPRLGRLRRRARAAAACSTSAAGSAGYSKALADRGFDVRRLDVVPEYVERARALGVDADAYDGERLPLDDGAVDTVFLLEVLEHLEDPAALLARGAPGGPAQRAGHDAQLHPELRPACRSSSATCSTSTTASSSP